MSREKPPAIPNVRAPPTTVSEVMEDWSKGQSDWMELVTSRVAEGQGGLLRPRTQGEVGPGGEPPSPGPAALPLTWHGQEAAVSGGVCPRTRSPDLRSWGSDGPCPGSRRGCARSQRDAPPGPPGWQTRQAGARAERAEAPASPPPWLHSGHPPPPQKGSCPTSEGRKFELREVTVLLTAEPDTVSSLSLLPAWTGLSHSACNKGAHPVPGNLWSGQDSRPGSREAG